MLQEEAQQGWLVHISYSRGIKVWAGSKQRGVYFLCGAGAWACSVTDYNKMQWSQSNIDGTKCSWRMVRCNFLLRRLLSCLLLDVGRT